jgi:plasmid stabilization system protein ParE
MNAVTWHQRALDRLADIYVAASPEEREAVTRAAEEVNRELGDQPAQQGESREGRLRVTFFGRMTVFFQTPAQPTDPVRVTWVRWSAKRR